MNIYPLANEIKAIESAEDVDLQTIQDTIEAMPIDEALDNAQKWRKNIQGDITAIEDEIKRLQKRKSALKNKDDSIKEAMFYVLSKTGQKSIKTPLFTFSKRKGMQKLVIDPECEEILVEMGYVKTRTVIDKDAIKDELGKGWAIPGVSIETSQETLQVR